VRKRLPHLRPSLIASAVALAVCVATGLIRTGAAGALGAAAGVALVVASYAGSSVVLAWLDMVNRQLILPVGLGMYVVKFSLFGVFLSVVQSAGWDGTIAMALSMAVAVAVWVVTQAVWVYRSRIPYVDLTES
jgi:hypothetical protein